MTNTGVKALDERTVTRLRPKARKSRLNETAIWEPFRDGWRRLYGGIYDLGVSIEAHDFKTAEAFEWSRSFHPESLELCFNIEGSAEIQFGEKRVEFQNSTAGFYLPGNNNLSAWRTSATRHRFITIEFSAEFLRRYLSQCDGALDPAIDGFVRGDSSSERCGEIRKLTVAHEQQIAELLNPPVVLSARQLWYQGAILEIMADFFFGQRGQDELFCDRQKRLARERVELVIAQLRQNLVEPLSLQELGRRVGCSPYHLSRTFSAEIGATISQYLRKLRMERAAELLHSGKYNVTEAALEVGYSSLSHFSQSFCQEMGCCPGLYPLRKTQ